MSLYFLGELTLDTIKYANGVVYENIMGGAALYSTCGAAIWNDSTNNIVTTIGDGYPVDLFEEICNKIKINTNHTERKNIPCIKLDIPYDEAQEHKFILKDGSGSYDDLCPDITCIRHIDAQSSIHIATMPLFKQLQYILSLQNAKYISLDPSIDDIRFEYISAWKLLLSKLDFFLVSNIEMERFVSVCFGGEKISDKLVFKFMEHFLIKNLVLKLGEKGAKLYTFEKKVFSVSSTAENPLDVTGAGDSFAGGFLYAVDKFNDPVRAMKYASISSGLIVKKIGVTDLEFVDNKSKVEDIKILGENNYE